MRNFLQTIGLLTIFITVLGCDQASKINATSDKRMYRSVATIASRVPKQHRMEFEVAFWSLHNGAKDKNEFRKEISGKGPAEVVEMARADFADKKAAGDKDYSKYESWEDLLKKLKLEKESYDKAHAKKDPLKKRDSTNQILGLQ